MKPRFLILATAYALGALTVLFVERGGLTRVERPVSASDPRPTTPTRPLQPGVPKVSQPTKRNNAQPATVFSDPIDDFGAPPRSVPEPVRPVEPSDADIASLAPAAPTEEEIAKLSELREKFSSLAKTKADLLNATTLEAEIGSLEREIANLHAARRLLDARQTLEQLMIEFPQSPAAERANQMLKAPASAPVTKPLIQPVPDPFANSDNRSS